MQLLNAEEAKYHYVSQNSLFVFLEFKHERDILALNKYKDALECNQLVVVKFTNIKYIDQDIELIQYLRKYTYENVFIGYFSTRIRQYLANLDYLNMILIDDGTYTLALHNELYRGIDNKELSMLKTFKLRNKKNIISKIIYYKNYFLQKYAFLKSGLIFELTNYQLNFFTIYNLEQYFDERITKNTYSVLHKKYSNNKKITQKEKFVYFLGQTLHKSLGLPADSYKTYLLKVIDYYKNKNIKIKYISHRSESDEYQKIIYSLKSDYFYILNIHKSFELYLLEEPFIPFCVASFYSSALFTSKYLYPSLVVESFVLEVQSKNREDITLIYKALEKENIRLIRLLD